MKSAGPEVTKLYAWETQLSIKFIMLINVIMPKIVQEKIYNLGLLSLVRLLGP